jgi:hypothetical protein
MTAAERPSTEEAAELGVKDGRIPQSYVLAEVQRVEELATKATQPRDPVAEDRSFVTRVIIVTFCASIAAVFVMSLVRGLDPISGIVIDFLKTFLFPVVTLILGHYFGQNPRNG